MILKVSSVWLGDIERIVDLAVTLYKDNPSKQNYDDLKNSIRYAKDAILIAAKNPTLNSLVDSKDKTARKILSQYTEYYRKLINLNINL